MEQSVQPAALRREVAPLAFTACWALMNVQLAALRLEAAPQEFAEAPINGKVGAICRPLAASYTSGVYRLLGTMRTDDWNNRCNLPPCGDKVHFRH